MNNCLLYKYVNYIESYNLFAYLREYLFKLLGLGFRKRLSNIVYYF